MILRGASMLHRLPRKRSARVETRSSQGWILALLHSDCSGGALVEAAVFMPVYLILLTGMVATVMALSTYQKVDYATFVAAEAIGTGRNNLKNADPCASVVAAVTGGLPNLTAANFTYTVWITQTVSGVTSVQKYGPTTGSSFSCTGSSTTAGNGWFALSNAGGQPVTVQVSYAYNWLPIFWNKLSGNLTTIESAFVSQKGVYGQ